MKYKNFLSSSYWKSIRDEVLKRDNNRCVNCNNSNNLHIHHKTYTFKQNETHLNIDKLVTLCGTCHKKEHRVIHNNKKIKIHKDGINTIIEYLVFNEYSIIEIEKSQYHICNFKKRCKQPSSIYVNKDGEYSIVGPEAMDALYYSEYINNKEWSNKSILTI